MCDCAWELQEDDFHANRALIRGFSPKNDLDASRLMAFGKLKVAECRFLQFRPFRMNPLEGAMRKVFPNAPRKALFSLRNAQ